MFWAGLALVTLLSLFACTAAIAVCLRLRFDSKAETGTAAAVVWSILVLGPIYGLGSFHLLTAPCLAATSAGTSALTLGLALGDRAKERWAATRRMALRLLGLPFEGLAEAWRAGSLTFIGLGAALLLLAYEVFSSYWLPSWRGWDALWYHEPIVGWAIQNHGLQVVDLPVLNGVQKVNGYPKVAEMTALWFTIFTDRRLIDLQSCLVAALLMLAMYALARRVSEDRVTSMGWGAALLLMPATTQELQSLYIDINYAWAALATLLFATRPVLRLRDCVVCTFAATLLAGTKPQAVLLTPLLLLIALVRLIAGGRHGARAILGITAFAFVLVGGMAASVYLRNYLHFHNPLWPDLKLDNERWNIHWPGLYEPNEGGTSSRDGLDLNVPWSQFFTDALSAPYSWHKWHYGDIHDYDMGVVWLACPIGIIAGVLAVLATFRHWLGGFLSRPRWRVTTETRMAAFVVVPLVIVFWTSTARWGARYHISTVAMVMILCAWLSGRQKVPRLGEGIVAAALIGGIAGNFWCERWWVPPTDLARLMRIPYPEREVTSAPDFTSSFLSTGSFVTREAGLAREREQVVGSVLAFPTSFGSFPSIFWNDRFSNKVVWVADGPDFVKRAEDANATWLFMANGDPNAASVRSAPGWELVGEASIEHSGNFYRRVR